jgi:hypothetical protein
MNTSSCMAKKKKLRGAKRLMTSKECQGAIDPKQCEAKTPSAKKKKSAIIIKKLRSYRS